MKNDIHEVSWPCDYWRRCCCRRADDGHCWGCGCEKSAHGNGDDDYFLKKAPAAVLALLEDKEIAP